MSPNTHFLQIMASGCEITCSKEANAYGIALASQQAALNALRPGVTAHSVLAAYANVIQQAGYEYPFRCGRATGYSFLEKPQLVAAAAG